MNVTYTDLVWNVVQTGTPFVVKDCTKCSKRSQFVCSEKFRVNAQQRSLDVWLIYRCVACDSTWNCRLMRRVAPTSIDPDLYAKFLSNDRATALRYASDLALLTRNGVTTKPRGDVALEGPELRPDTVPTGKARILVVCEIAGRWRLDRLLAAKLGVSRSRLERLIAEGAIHLDPPARKLGAPLKGRTLIVVTLRHTEESSRSAAASRCDYALRTG